MYAIAMIDPFAVELTAEATGEIVDSPPTFFLATKVDGAAAWGYTSEDYVTDDWDDPHVFKTTVLHIAQSRMALESTHEFHIVKVETSITVEAVR